MSSEAKNDASTTIGCLTIISAFPAAVIWWVLFGLMLHKTNAGTAEWSLYAGLLVLSVLAFVLGSVFKLMEKA